MRLFTAIEMKLFILLTHILVIFLCLFQDVHGGECYEQGVYGVVYVEKYNYTDAYGVDKSLGVIKGGGVNSLEAFVSSRYTVIEKVECLFSDMACGSENITYQVNSPSFRLADYLDPVTEKMMVVYYRIFVKPVMVDISKLTPAIEAQLRIFSDIPTDNLVPILQLNPYMSFSNVSYEDFQSIVDVLDFLVGLNISSGEFETIPDGIKNFDNLTSLFVNNCGLVNIPAEIGELDSLLDLTLANSKIEVLPPEISKLHSLRHLYIYNNQFKYIPEALSELSNLELLDMEGNNIVVLPKDVFLPMSGLRFLWLSNNRITELPKGFGLSEKVEHLSLHDNPLRTLPSSLATHQFLEISVGDSLICLPEAYANSPVRLGSRNDEDGQFVLLNSDKIAELISNACRKHFNPAIMNLLLN